MSKVFCKDCKHLRYDKDCMGGQYFCTRDEIVEIDPLGYETCTNWHSPEEKNKDYACKTFQRKWWKIWIKGN